MADIRQVTPDFAVAPQIEPEDLAEAVARGFRLVINNRPDGESPDQPSSALMQTAAEAAGLSYRYIPVRGGPGPSEIEAMVGAVAEAQGPVLAYCRSGTRSIITWSLGQVVTGARDRSELVQLGREAGYELSGVLG
jgi:uncharacterized protein (TIGR01244 family)